MVMNVVVVFVPLTAHTTTNYCHTVSTHETVLGTLPLTFSTSDIFQTVFIAFLALVVLGVSHGLLLLPVILSFIGPEDHVVLSSSATAAANGPTAKKEETARGVVVAKTMPPKTTKSMIRPDHRLEEIHC
jgi:hypothetical protein